MSSGVVPVPGSDSRPPMPDPRRTVARSVKFLTSRGYSIDKALALIRQAASGAQDVLAMAGIDDTWWLDEIVRHAIYWPGAAKPDGTKDKGGGHVGTPAGSHRHQSTKSAGQQQIRG